MPFQKGQVANPNGRPKTSWRREFEEAIKVVEKEKRRNLFRHFIRQAFVDNTVLVALMKKRLPDLKAVEAKVVMESPYRLVIELPQPKALPDSKQVALPVNVVDGVTSKRKPVKSKTSKVKTKQSEKLSG